MCVAPRGASTGHVFNQRQQNAFIKPITDKSCGAEPHSHFHYGSRGDSHLHLTWRLSSHPLPICLCHLLFHSFICSTQVCQSPQLHDDGLCKHEHFVNLLCFLPLSGTHSSYSPPFTIMALTGKSLGDLYALTLKDLRGSSNGWENSATLELIKICSSSG